MPLTMGPLLTAVESLTWVDEDDVSHLLTDEANGYLFGEGSVGRYLAPATIIEDPRPFGAGARYRATLREPRDYTIPFIVTGDNRAETLDRLRALMAWFRGRGRLQRISADGLARELVCSVSVVEAPDDPDNRWETGHRAGATFHASDPYWQETEDTEVEYTVDVTTPSFYPITFPILMSGSTVFSRPTITNTSAAFDTTDTYPVWTFRGPGNNPTVRNTTTGELTRVVIDLSSGEYVVIDTRPSSPSISDGAGTDLMGLKTKASTLWPIVRGVNVLQIEMNSPGVGSSVTLAWRKKFENG